MKLLPDDLCMALVRYLGTKPIDEAIMFWDRLRQLPDAPMPMPQPRPENNLMENPPQ